MKDSFDTRTEGSTVVCESVSPSFCMRKENEDEIESQTQDTAFQEANETWCEDDDVL